MTGEPDKTHPAPAGQRMGFLLPMEFLCAHQEQAADASGAAFPLVRRVPQQVLEDLELVGDVSGNPWQQALHDYGRPRLPWAEYYSTDPALIRTLREWYIRVGTIPRRKIDSDPPYPEFAENGRNEWMKFVASKVCEEDFCDKHGLFSWSHTRFLNAHPLALQLSNLYSLAAPALQLVLPLVMMLIPFVLIKFVFRLPLTFDRYKAILTAQLRTHSIGQVFSVFDSEKSLQQRATALGLFALYVYSIYQNAMSCVKHAGTIRRVNEFLRGVRDAVSHSLWRQRETTDMLAKLAAEHGTEGKLLPYMEHLRERIVAAEELLEDLERNAEQVGANPGLNPTSLMAVGDSLHLYYRLYTDEGVRRTVEHCMDESNFVWDCMFLRLRQMEGMLEKCQFTDEGDATQGKPDNQKGKKDKKGARKERKRKSAQDDNGIVMRGMAYPFLFGKHKVRNDYITGRGERTRFITGPNASGKTTYIKTVLINLLFSQQVGMGFYRSATIRPYHVFHSYLTIPDTSGRDSLFQAEARRCLEILRAVEAGAGERHFAIFDELFSGTNSVEAVDIAQAYLEHMRGQPFQALVTTHFGDLVERCVGKEGAREKGRAFASYRMAVDVGEGEGEGEKEGDGEGEKEGDGGGGGDNTDIAFTYRIEPGMNGVRGAVRVLRGLGYPGSVLGRLSRERA